LKRIKWKFKNVPIHKMFSTIFKSKPKILYPESKVYDVPEKEDSTLVDIEPTPFLLIKPIGMKNEDKIKKILLDNGIIFIGEMTIEDYRLFSYEMFGNVPKVEIDYWNHILETQYDEEHNNKAKALILEKGTDVEELDKVKRKIRKKVGIDFYQIYLNQDWVETSLTPVHSPDEDKVEKEFKIILKHSEEYEVQSTPDDDSTNAMNECEEVTVQCLDFLPNIKTLGTERII